MDYLEKFDYRNFGKFINEIVSNPDVVKKRDLLAEQAYDWFDISRDDVHYINKDEVVKDLYKYMSLSFYIVFKDNPEATKIDVMTTKTVEKNFPEDVYYLKRNKDNWQYLLTYYSGMIDALSKVLLLKNNKQIKQAFGGDNDDDEGDNEE